MVLESSIRSDGAGAAQHEAFIEVETAGSVAQIQGQDPALTICLERGLELRINNHIGVELAACFVERLEAPTAQHCIRLEYGPIKEGGAR